MLAPILRDSLHLTAKDYRVIVPSFQLGVMLAEFPMGVLMDWRGVRFAVSFAVLWWSAANAMRALAQLMTQLCVLRFWPDTGQCKNFSGVKTVSH